MYALFTFLSRILKKKHLTFCLKYSQVGFIGFVNKFQSIVHICFQTILKSFDTLWKAMTFSFVFKYMYFHHSIIILYTVLCITYPLRKNVRERKSFRERGYCSLPLMTRSLGDKANRLLAGAGYKTYISTSKEGN